MKNNTPYHTRYGVRTASESALELLDRSAERLNFLQEVFNTVHHDGDGFTLPGYSSKGLSAILEDIRYDVRAAHNYFYGDDPTPGKEYDAPEASHE